MKIEPRIEYRSCNIYEANCGLKIGPDGPNVLSIRPDENPAVVVVPYEPSLRSFPQET